MANSVNKATLIGHLGRDPELRATSSGQSVTSFSIATNEKWTSKSGTPEERTEWHNIVAWGRLAEICSEFLTKGSQVYVEGRLQTREFTDKDGNNRQRTEINAREVVFLGGKGAGQGRDFSGGGDGGYSGGGARPVGPAAQPAVADDDIPF